MHGWGWVGGWGLGSRIIRIKVVQHLIFDIEVELSRVIIVFILVNGHLHPLGRFYEWCVYRCLTNKKSSIYMYYMYCISMIGKESTRYRLFDDVLQPLGIVSRRQPRRLSIAVFRYTERSSRVMMNFDMAQDLWLGGQSCLQTSKVMTNLKTSDLFVWYSY